MNYATNPRAGRPFQLENALHNWFVKYPDKRQRIEVLHQELLKCYPQFPLTSRNIARMLERLEK